jgi:hypothetical protein
LLNEPEIVTEVENRTVDVFTVKVALAAPAAMVTLGGTRAAPVLLLERMTWAPPAGAGPLRVTVPVEELPPGTLEGLNVSEEKVGSDEGVTVSEAVWVAPL